MVTALFFSIGITPTVADIQEIAPGTGPQGATVVDTGANGLCETTASRDDIQATPVGKGPPFQDEIRCGPDKIASTTAAGDDRQLVPPGTTCENANVAVVDTGPDGIANTIASGDDGQLIPVGTAPPNAPCVIAGPNGIGDTTRTGDDVQVIPVGTALANTAVIRCGPNKVAETHANNAKAGGDDVQRVPVGMDCAGRNTVVVDSGPNGIAETRAEGSDLLLKIAKPIRMRIGRGKAAASRTVRVAVANVEFGTAAPPSRLYTLDVTDGSCPDGTVSLVDADARAPGLQTTANVPRGGKLKGSFVVTLRLEDVVSVARAIPFRCAVDVEADVLDPALGNAPDDGVNPAGNRARVYLEAIDVNDL
jgi:hypothetical protein